MNRYMNDQANLKSQLLCLAASQVEEFLSIISDVGYQGYLIYKYKSKGNSMQQCANKYGVSKRIVQGIVEKCNAKGYGAALFKLNMLN